MSNFIATPMSRAAIRAYAQKIRKLLGLDNLDFVHAPKLFDKFSVLLEKEGLDFDYRVLPDNNPIFCSKEEAFTDMTTGILYIKESVMEQACRRAYKRGSFTLIHELGHYLLHYLQNSVKFARATEEDSIPIYCDPEWQADTFASEFLMPFEECASMEPNVIRKTYHVSSAAAEVRYDVVHRELKK